MPNLEKYIQTTIECGYKPYRIEGISNCFKKIEKGKVALIAYTIKGDSVFLSCSPYAVSDNSEEKAIKLLKELVNKL